MSASPPHTLAPRQKHNGRNLACVRLTSSCQKKKKSHIFAGLDQSRRLQFGSLVDSCLLLSRCLYVLLMSILAYSFLWYPGFLNARLHVLPVADNRPCPPWLCLEEVFGCFRAVVLRFSGSRGSSLRRETRRNTSRVKCPPLALALAYAESASGSSPPQRDDPGHILTAFSSSYRRTGAR